MKWVLRILLGIVLVVGSFALALHRDWVELGLIWAGFAVYFATRKP
jgi:hypothetical protein